VTFVNRSEKLGNPSKTRYRLHFMGVFVATVEYTPDPNSVIELLEAREAPVDDALANVESIAQQIRMLGGSVEIRITGQSEEASG
jgi:hypothetical protein